MILKYNKVMVSMEKLRLRVQQKEIEAFCRKNHILRLALFGSVVREDFRPDSDVDVLVEFEPGHVPGLAFFRMQEDLTQLLGRSVDLNTAACISPLFRKEVFKEAQLLYVAA
jgi:hypothetical protein